MIKRNRLKMVALMLVTALVLAACGGDGATTTAAGGGADNTEPAQDTTTTAAEGATTSAEGVEGASSFDELLAAAEAEGVLYYADSVAPEVMAAVNEAFNERFGIDVEIELVEGRAADLFVRMQQEDQAGQVTIDGTHASTGLLYGSLDAGLDFFDRYDYVSTFSEELPGIENVVNRVPEALVGVGLEGTHLVRAVGYNTELVPEDEVPTSWDDLLKPEFEGWISLDPAGSSTYQNVAAWDNERVLQYSKDLAATNPLWIEGDDIFASVGRGEAKVGIATMVRYGNVLADEPDLPLALAPVEFYPVTQQLIFVAKNSPHINLARLYAAWQAVEGMKVFTELGQIRERTYTDDDSLTSQRIAEVGVETIMIETQEDLARADEVREQIVEYYNTLGVGG